MKIRFTHSILTVLFISICCFLPIAGEAQAGSITGIMVDDDGGGAVPNVRVAVYAANDDTVIIAEDNTDAAGGYSVTGLGNGDYKVWFITGATGYIKKWYDGGDGSLDFTGAQLVPVTSETPVNLGETRLILGGKITGTVTYSDAPPSAAVYVQAYDSGGRWVETFVVNSSTGIYEIFGLPTGSYTLHFYAYQTDYVSEWYDDVLAQGSATPVPVTQPSVTSGKDAQLTLGGEISGQVSDAGGGITGALVKAYDSADSSVLLGFTTTVAGGTYTITGLPTGTNNLKVEFFETGSGDGMTEWYNDKLGFFSADAVSTGDSGINAVLEPSSTSTTGNLSPVYMMLGLINSAP